ncbi:MAG: RsmB/NOP family class I SAM-dependent RNA methyltransferase, partial [Alphaproteobacteria bacterium]
LVDALPNAALLPQGSVRLAAAGRIEDLPGYRDGRWWVQDAAAAMPALLLRVRSGQRAIDLCAAPGGKTLQLAAAGAAVTAVDLSPARLARLADNLKRTGLDAALVCADAADWRPDAPAEAVLLDAPCTATGTLRRRPDIAHRKNADDIAAMAAVQRRLLDHAASMLAPGGVLVYAVCSLEREEGEDRVADFLAMHPHFRRQPVVAAEMPGLEQALTAAGDVRILPSHWQARGGIDGFFIARLRTAA